VKDLNEFGIAVGGGHNFAIGVGHSPGTAPGPSDASSFRPAHVSKRGAEPLTGARDRDADLGTPMSAVRTRAFARARSHSRWVRFFKRAIPVGALVGIAGIVFATWFDPFGEVEGLTLGPVTVSGSHVTMESPRLTGFRNDSRPYEVTASSARQDVRKPNLVELSDLKARIVTDDQGNAARLEAVSGILDTQKEQMELRRDVRVRTDGGQDVRLTSAFVDFKAGTVVSNEPVTVSLGNGVIRAAGLEVTDNGKVLHFRGRVSTVFDGPAERPPSGAAQGPTASAVSLQPTSLRP